MKLVQFLRDDRGATSIEYALIGSLIFLVIIGAVGAVGTNLQPIFQSVAAAL